MLIGLNGYRGKLSQLFEYSKLFLQLCKWCELFDVGLYIGCNNMPAVAVFIRYL